MSYYQKQRALVLEARKEMLDKNNGKFPKGMSKARKEYIKLLNEHCTLTSFQKEVLLGCLLSDMSLDVNHKTKEARVKMQMSVKSRGYLEWVREVLKEYSGNDFPFNHPSKQRVDMLDFTSITCSQFYELHTYFQHESTNVPFGELDPTTNKKAPKGVCPSILRYFGPVLVANWFCGDGGLADAKQNSKGVAFATHCFSRTQLAILQEGLQSFQFETYLSVDKKTKPDQLQIIVRSASFDQYVKSIGPWIHPTFHRRVASGRSDNSKKGDMNETLRNKLLGSSLIKYSLDDLICFYPNMFS
jgi:hypothetical protein